MPEFMTNELIDAPLQCMQHKIDLRSPLCSSLNEWHPVECALKLPQLAALHKALGKLWDKAPRHKFGTALQQVIGDCGEFGELSE